ncbi:MAG TPA: hypothetical protein VFD64_10085 [Gemmatimonadaceae bacterium]|nr:hypothetical protein [Gemmatimonadaceae bacterium]
MLPLRSICRRVRSVTLALGTLAALAACTDPARIVTPLTEPQQPSHLFIPATGTFEQVRSGNLHTCALRADGVMQCWGSNFGGESPPVQQAGVGVYTTIGTGLGHTCAVRSDGKIECFGYNQFGYANPLYAPQNGGRFVDVGGGRYNTCGLRDDGAVECFGERNASPLPLVTANVGFFTHLGVGDQHGCALRNDGVVQCWGGYPPSQEAPPIKTASTGYFTQVGGGSLFACALRNDGAVECWGYGFADGRDAALKTAASGYFTQLNVAYDHSCAIRDDGRVECWGNNAYGQAPALKAASNGGRFIQVDGGAFHSCGLRDDKTIECWGQRWPAAGTTVLPTATFNAPSSIAVNASIPLSLTNALVPGYPTATTFTYAFNCGGGYSTPSSSNTFSCPTTATGTRLVKGKVIDQDGDEAEYTKVVSVKDASESTTDLKVAISTATLSPDVRKALTAKLNAALDAIARGKTQAACSALQDFINQVAAQREKAITTETADLWIEQATNLRTSLGC